MLPDCPYCQLKSEASSLCPPVVRAGHFYRKSDSRRIQRFSCRKCRRSFSRATTHPCFGQNKRQFNEIIRRLLCSGVSQRRAAGILNLNRNTVVRKLLFLAKQAQLKLGSMNHLRPQTTTMEFDDLETFEHTKCKPLSITLAVEHKTRHILGFEVSQMPAKGLLAKLARKKYGIRKDERRAGREKLFARIRDFVDPKASIKSDENPHYVSTVKKHFPDCDYKRFKGRRGAIVGQGELKKIGFDPLFSLNHTCAKFRADINRLFRRTWCTTKRPDRLAAHIAVYAVFHNEALNG